MTDLRPTTPPQPVADPAPSDPPPVNGATPPSEQNWWARNRVPLLLLLPLLALAVLASSYNLFVLYRPTHITRPHQASGPTLTYHETVSDSNFGAKATTYSRKVDMTLESVRPTSTYQGERAAKGARLWVVTLEFRAPPGVILEGCHLALVDTEGVVYGDSAGKSGTPQWDTGCVPREAPGATLSFDGSVVTEGNPRPPAWQVQRTVSMPEGRQPHFVRVAWQTPDYAQFDVNAARNR